MNVRNPTQFCILFLFFGGCDFKNPSIFDLIGCMWFFFIWCAKNLTKSKKKKHLSGAALRFSFLRMLWYCWSVCNVVSVVVSWLKTSSRYVIVLFSRMSGLKMQLIKDEKAAGPIEIPQNRRLKQYCYAAITKFVSLCDGLSSGIWLYSLFMSAIEKTGPLIRFSLICMGSMGQLHFL